MTDYRIGDIVQVCPLLRLGSEAHDIMAMRKDIKRMAQEKVGGVGMVKFFGLDKCISTPSLRFLVVEND